MRVLRQFPSYKEFLSKTQADSKGTTELQADVAADVSPQDLLDQAVKENRAAVGGELLQRALALPPVGFEDLVIKLLSAMG